MQVRQGSAEKEHVNKLVQEWHRQSKRADALNRQNQEYEKSYNEVVAQLRLANRKIDKQKKQVEELQAKVDTNTVPNDDK